MVGFWVSKKKNHLKTDTTDFFVGCFIGIKIIRGEIQKSNILFFFSEVQPLKEKRFKIFKQKT